MAIPLAHGPAEVLDRSGQRDIWGESAVGPGEMASPMVSSSLIAGLPPLGETRSVLEGERGIKIMMQTIPFVSALSLLVIACAANDRPEPSESDCHDRSFRLIYGQPDAEGDFFGGLYCALSPCPQIEIFVRDPSDCLGPDYDPDTLPEYDPASGQCVLDSIRAGTPGSYVVADCSPGPAREIITVVIGQDGVMTWDQNLFNDLIQTRRETRRQLPDVGFLDSCDAGTPAGIWDCMTRLGDATECVSGVPTCP